MTEQNKIVLPPFTLQPEGESVWFILLDGELKGVMFRLMMDDDALAVPEQMSVAYDIATNQYFEGGEERLESLFPEIEKTVSLFIEYAIQDISNKIASGEMKIPMDGVTYDER